MIRAGTSVGSNMHEADEAVSKKDFINHVKIARKEARVEVLAFNGLRR